MQIDSRREGQVLVLTLDGRLDAHGAKALGDCLSRELTHETSTVVLNMEKVPYLSSAGVRVFVGVSRELGTRAGALVMAGMQLYAFNVLEISGLADAFLRFDRVSEALAHAGPLARDAGRRKRWAEYETYETAAGSVRIIPESDDRGVVHLIGTVREVLECTLTADDIASKSFGSAEYSIGMGGLGDKVEDYLGIMGEMMTIGGTMVWLPTDGNDTADFLIPRVEGGGAGGVQMRVGFNAAIDGRFNDLVHFVSNKPGGATLSELYRALFDLSRSRVTTAGVPYRGALALAMRAQVGGLVGSGVKRAPIHRNKPVNGKMIIDPSNLAEWFESDHVPRHMGTTGLFCGMGIDLTHDLSGLEREMVEAAFWRHPDNVGSKLELLHNHATLFPRIGFTHEKPVNLEAEIGHVVDHSEFLDMRHVLDTTTIQEAVIGVSYVQAIEEDPHAREGW
jgi:anti-anti-sigma factor